jgi:hypothetical protein
MLRAVGNPVVVNPDEELARVARDEGWRIMRFERLGRRLALAGLSGFLVVAGLLGRHRISGRSRGPTRAAASRVRRG